MIPIARFQSCLYLHQGINFNLDAIAPCCPGTKYTPPSIPYSGGKLPLEAIISCFQNAEELNQTPNGPCIGCPYLQPGEPTGGWGKFRTITFNHFRRCNSRCNYCNGWMETKSHRYELVPTIMEMIAGRLFFDEAMFFWGGGEPTILPEFEKLFSLVHTGTFRQLVNTNALRYSEVLAQGLEGGNTTVQISLDCGTRETYRRIKGLDAYDTVVNNIARLCHRKRGESIILKYIVKNDNCSSKDINAFLGICVRNNIRHIVISPETAEAWENRISDQAIAAAITLKRKALNRGMTVNILRELYGHANARRIDERPPLHRVIDRTAQAFFRFPAHVRKILPHH